MTTYASFDYSTPNTVPKLKLGSKAQFVGSDSVYTVAKVSPNGGTAVLRCDTDGKKVKVRRMRVSRRALPPELGLSDVYPRYRTGNGREIR